MLQTLMALLAALLMLAATATPNTTVSPGLAGKFMMGYQGWFGTPCDGMGVGWKHWAGWNHTPGQDPHPTGAVLKFDPWPDLTEFSADELCDTDLKFADGSVAGLFSSANYKTVHRHFEWMKTYHVDGVFKQRFLAGLVKPNLLAFDDRVVQNAKRAAEATDRAWAIMYDISGIKDADVLSALMKDWRHLVNRLRITSSSSYLWHRGKPLVAIWGLGFLTRDPSAETALKILDFFKAEGVTVMGGTPTSWRTLNHDSKRERAWASFYRALDVISPWTVGRVHTYEEIDAFLTNNIIPDTAEARAAGADYMPVIFPGGSSHNRDPVDQPFLNANPRRGGRFFWHQLYDYVGKGKATMIYGAMFDEVNEGTAYFKIAATKKETPTNANFTYSDIDGDPVPSDWWLRLAGHAADILKGARKLSPKMPAPRGIEACRLACTQDCPLSKSVSQKVCMACTLKSKASMGACKATQRQAYCISWPSMNAEDAPGPDLVV